jgi:hypothetical protein
MGSKPMWEITKQKRKSSYKTYGTNKITQYCEITHNCETMVMGSKPMWET